MSSKSPIFDDLSNLVNNALGAAKGVGDEVKAAARARTDSLIADMDLVGREEFEVLKDMVTACREENDSLKAEIKTLKSEMTKLKKAMK